MVNLNRMRVRKNVNPARGNFDFQLAMRDLGVECHLPIVFSELPRARCTTQTDEYRQSADTP